MSAALRWLLSALIVPFAPAPPAAAHPGVGIVMNQAGDVFFTDLHHVWRLGADGRREIAVRDVHTHELCLDAEGNLYGEHLWYEGEAVDRWGHRVWRLGPDGSLADVIPAREGFLTGYSFVRDAAGNMYWADRGEPTLIVKRDAAGAISTLAVCADCRNVRRMTASPDGHVYFVDDVDLREVSPSGVLRTVARDLGERSFWQFNVFLRRHNIMGIWTDQERNVYLAVNAGRVVKKVTPSGEVTVAARTSPPWSPTGGFAAPNGDLWLLEGGPGGGVRVRRIAPDGRESVF